MTDQQKIRSSAEFLARKFDTLATFVATRLADQFLEKGDVAAYKAWTLIMRSLESNDDKSDLNAT